MRLTTFCCIDKQLVSVAILTDRVNDVLEVKCLQARQHIIAPSEFTGPGTRKFDPVSLMRHECTSLQYKLHKLAKGERSTNSQTAAHIMARMTKLMTLRTTSNEQRCYVHAWFTQPERCTANVVALRYDIPWTESREMHKVNGIHSTWTGQTGTKQIHTQVFVKAMAPKS